MTAEQADEVASPCINVCRMNPDTELCEGCLRTLDEIAAWSAMSADEKRAVLARIPARRP
ncbi:MAG TPA: DUF1289 domain-containing protein [Burkholderiales bacterium]|nr:DUF1289 domain-containing protein [Burkholderiales bacterium]